MDDGWQVASASQIPLKISEMVLNVEVTQKYLHRIGLR